MAYSIIDSAILLSFVMCLFFAEDSKVFRSGRIKKMTNDQQHSFVMCLFFAEDSKVFRSGRIKKMTNDQQHTWHDTE